MKNITGHYRLLLDTILEARPELARASSGRVRLAFTPDPDKTFHRGATDYFTRGRQADIGAFDTPAFVGVPLGSVTRVGPDWFELHASAPLSNGDGLTYPHKRAVVGMQANRVEATGPGGVWRVWPNEPVAALAGLKPGTEVSRNRDRAWETALARPSARRLIEVRGRLAETADGFAFTLTDTDGIEAGAAAVCDKQPARDPEPAQAGLRAHLARLGDTEFQLAGLDIDWRQPWFVPASLANRLRREAADRLMAARLAAHRRPRRRPEALPPTPYPADTLSYLANVYNQAARAFHARHGVRLIDAAFEAHREAGEVSLMITRHCLRYSFSLCPKQAKGVTGVQGQVRAEPMTLVNGSERLTLTFDCRACEMHVVGRIKKHILKSPPPSVAGEGVPVSFHGRRAGKG